MENRPPRPPAESSHKISVSQAVSKANSICLNPRFSPSEVFKLNGVPVFADGRKLIQPTAENMAKSGMQGFAGGMLGLCSISFFQANIVLQLSWISQTFKRNPRMDIMDRQEAAKISVASST